MNRQSHILKGTVFSGFGVASHTLRPYMNAVRAQTGLHKLIDGTLNLRLDEGPYVGHANFIFAKGQYNPSEDTYFERCKVKGLPGLIMRTSTNAHGYGVLELMGESNFRNVFGLKDGDHLEVEVFDP